MAKRGAELMVCFVDSSARDTVHLAKADVVQDLSSADQTVDNYLLQCRAGENGTLCVVCDASGELAFSSSACYVPRADSDAEAFFDATSLERSDEITVSEDGSVRMAINVFAVKPFAAVNQQKDILALTRPVLYYPLIEGHQDVGKR